MDNWANTWYKEIEDITNKYKIGISFEEVEKLRNQNGKRKLNNKLMKRFKRSL